MSGAARPSTGDEAVRPGDVLDEKYRVERVIGRGRAGLIVEASGLVLGERVAIRLPPPEVASQREAAEQFLREARAATAIKSEHSARVTDVGTLGTGAPYMVMELVKGTDLASTLESYGPCQPPNAVDYLLQACEAIAEAHSKGVLHRDLRPARLFLATLHDGSSMIKVTGLGVSKASAGVALSATPYLAPEQIHGARDVDRRADVHALGACLYELLTGEPPLRAEASDPEAQPPSSDASSLLAIRPEVPEGLALVIEKARSPDREQRHQSVAELAAALAPYAPPRSQPSLDQIAQIAGLPPPIAGVGGYPSTPPPRAVRPGSDPGVPRVPPASARAVPASVYPMPVNIPMFIHGYEGPVSQKAAAAFASGASDVGPSAPPPAPRDSVSTRTLVLVGLALAAIVIGIGIGSALLWMRMQERPAAPALGGEAAPPSGTAALSGAPAPAGEPR